MFRLTILVALLLGGCFPEVPLTHTGYPTLPSYNDAEPLDIRWETPNVARVASFQCNDEPDEVLSFYRTALPKAGWVFDGLMTDGFVSVYHVEDGPSFTLEVQARREGARTEVRIRQVASGPYVWNEP